MESKEEVRSWHNTRFNTAKNRKPFEDVKSLRTPLVGAGESRDATIYKAVDSRTGNAFVIKKIQLVGDKGERDAHRAFCHREVKLLEKLDHVSRFSYFLIFCLRLRSTSYPRKTLTSKK